MPDDQQDQNPTPAVASEPPPSEFETRLAIFIGPRWESTYRRKLRPFLEDPAFTPTWNWAAALATPFWFLYRKMYLWFAVFVFVPGVVLQWLVPTEVQLTPENILEPQNRQLLLMRLAIQLSASLAAGGAGNWMLFRRARTAIRVVGMQPMSASDAQDLLRRVGGTSRGLTFTMLALFVVLGLAGSMAVLATP